MIIDFNKYNGGGSGSGVTPEQVQEQIDSALTPYWDSAVTVDYVDGAVSGIDLSNYYTKVETDSAITAVENHIYDVEEVTASAYTELHDDILELSARTVDLSGYYTSGETDAAISAATAGKADAQNVTPNNGALNFKFPSWNNQGIVTGPSDSASEFYKKGLTINGDQLVYLNHSKVALQPSIYAPTTRGTAGEVLISTGNGAPVWSAMPAGDVTKAYVDSADTALQDQIDTMDEVVSAALVNLNDTKVGSTDIKHMVKITQADYEDLTVKDPYTFYIIIDNS